MCRQRICYPKRAFNCKIELLSSIKALLLCVLLLGSCEKEALKEWAINNHSSALALLLFRKKTTTL